MDMTQHFTTQGWWTWWIAVYLYFGGLGAATLVVTFLTDLYRKPYRELVLWGALSGIVMLGSGSLILFAHLLHHAAVIHVLNPIILLKKPDAWIAWGTEFILSMMVWGFLYALPYLRESPTAHRIPVFGFLLRISPVIWLAEICSSYHRFIGWMATINGIGVAVYTGLLLQSFPAVALWHNPGVPLLFTVSAFSTAMAYLLLILNLINHRDEDRDLRHFYERTDLMLISAELIILFAFYQYLATGSESGVHSLNLLKYNLGWLVGFIGLGLLVPFALELKGALQGWGSRWPIVICSVLVLIGGYLLRYYFINSGVYAYPW